MNRFYKILSSRLFFWPLLIVPGLWRMVIPAMTDGLGFNPLFELLHRTGQIAVWLLVAVLALTPLKTLFPRARLVAALNRHRRAIGVAAFIYAALHATEYFIYEGTFKTYFAGVLKPFLLTGTVGIVTLTLLAATSNDFSVRRLTYKKWKWLHRLVYLATLALIWHVATQGKGNWPFARKVFVPLLALQLLRLGKPLAVWSAQKISRRRQRGAWDGWRDFEISQRETESETISSFYLRPTDGGPLPPFRPGQFLTIQLEIPGQERPVIRTYTISDAPNGKTYRLSIKREAAPSPKVAPGLVSNFFHDQMAVGKRLLAKLPAGKFQLDASSTRPIVFLSAGVGITPMMAMLNTLVGENSNRPIWFIHGARNSREHAFGRHLRTVAARHPNVRLHIIFSQPAPRDLAEELCHAAGRVEVELVKRLIGEPAADFYLCGPGPFMKALYDGLAQLGVPPGQIHYEFFGPATVQLKEANTAEASESAAPFRVEFAPSGTTATWEASEGNLLDFALARGLKPAYGCKAGVCGSCACRLASGKVAYAQEPAQTPEAEEILLCCARPASDVVISLAR